MPRQPETPNSGKPETGGHPRPFAGADILDEGDALEHGVDGEGEQHQLHVFTFPSVLGWKAASVEDVRDLGLDLAYHGIAFATKDGHRIDPSTVTVRDGHAYGGTHRHRNDYELLDPRTHETMIKVNTAEVIPRRI
jgi:hypothetical protein